MRKYSQILAVFALAIPVVAIACGDDETTPAAQATPSLDGGSPGVDSSTSVDSSTGTDAPAPKDIIETALAAGNFKLLAKALTKAELITTLKGTGPFTVLAPNDDAFAASEITEADIDAASKEALTALLTYHVIGLSADSAAVGTLTSAETLSPSGIGTAKLRVRIDAKTDGIRVYPTVDLSNPETKAPGAPATDPGAKVTTADIKTSNGIIHVLDRVLTPPTKDIAGAAAKYGLLDTLVTTLTLNPGSNTPSLLTILAGAGPFSVFAPTNDAFTNANAVIDTLSNEQVRTVLLYHVLPDAFATSGDVGKATATTALTTAATGKNLNVNPGNPPTLKDSTNTAGNFVATDIVTKNGIVHVVDKVLVPAFPN